MIQHFHSQIYREISLPDKKEYTPPKLYTTVAIRIINNSQIWESTQMPINWCMDKQNVVCSHKWNIQL